MLILLNFDFSLYLLKRYHIENYKVMFCKNFSEFRSQNLI